MIKNSLISTLKKRVILLDGATGTELKKRGMPEGVCPEKWCLENPRVISQVHTDYQKAGADIIYTSTFGANRIKLNQYKIKDVVSLNKELASLARKAVGRKSLVAGDIGPTGKFVKPFGSLDFEEAVDIFKEQIKGLLLGGVDLLVIETMMDIQEARAALIAAKELSDKFIMVTLTYEKSGRTLNGNDPISSLVTIQSLGADAFGCNCSTGPKQMREIISLIKPYAHIPLIAKPNAGLPKLKGTKAVFDMQAEEFSFFAKSLVSQGTNMLGGCCGTTPEHIYYLKRAVLGVKPVLAKRKAISALSSARKAIILEKKNRFILIGEKINPTGKKKLQKGLNKGKFTMLRTLAKEQERNGADLLDINIGIPGIDEKKVMLEAISSLSLISDLPLAIDSAKVEVIEAALRFYPGRALINSISGEKKKLKKLLFLAKKYGAMFIILPLAGRKLPLNFIERKEIITAIFKEAKKAGFSKFDILIDGLTMPLSCNPDAAIEIVKTIKWCSKVFKAKTVLGISNISFGFPQRHLINRVFLTLAKKNGLTAAIADPLDNRSVRNKLVENLLSNRDKGGAKFISVYSQLRQPRPKKERQIKGFSYREEVFRAILEGDKEEIKNFIREALKSGQKPSSLLKEVMVPAIIKTGELFEKKRYFLPQLIASAETMKKGLKHLEPFLKKKLEKTKKAIILLATVEGDIHDIGKNIVALILGNYGFRIIDLGKDVSTEKIIQKIKLYSPDIVGLSALMTTTMLQMAEVIRAAKKEGLKCKFMVGGAVLNKSYADSIGAQYAKDGIEAVKVAKYLLSKRSKT